MNWTHPTGKQPKNVVLVCLGHSHQNYIAAAMDRETPDWLLNADEVWTLNRGALVLKHDLAFVLDYLDGEAAHFPGYASMLWKHDRPLITSKAIGWPGHVYEYPFDSLWGWLTLTVRPGHQTWLINSVPLILIYAAWIGVKTLTIFGADYQGHSQQEDGHACLAYWTGMMEHQGLQVKVPDTTQLLGANRRYVYGYPVDADPRPDAVARRQRFQDLIGASPCISSPTINSNGQ
jgi:hypothetical protein